MIFLLQAVGAPMVGHLPQEIKIEQQGNISYIILYWKIY